MALNATIFTFDIDLADADRGVYQALPLRVARHPSETDAHMLARVLAYCLEYDDGIGFSRGVSTPDEPAVFVRDPTGAYRAWIDIGVPEADRLHRASKLAARVAVYTHKDPALLLRALHEKRIHGRAALACYALDPDLIAALAARLQRRQHLAVAVSGAHLFVTVGSETFSAAVARLALPD